MKENIEGSERDEEKKFKDKKPKEKKLDKVVKGKMSLIR